MWHGLESDKMRDNNQKTRAETVCSLGQNVFVLLNDKSRMKGDLHVRFREKFEVKVLLLTRLRGREIYLNFPPTRFSQKYIRTAYKYGKNNFICRSPGEHCQKREGMLECK